MKPFIFNNQEFQDLNSLGIAFSNQFDKALTSIQDKKFLKFATKFKSHKKIIRPVFFQCRYIQNVLSILIYLFTDEHILYIGHKRYNDLISCLKDVKKNPAIVYFAEDHGFSSTVLSHLADERLKSDLVAFEENAKDAFCLDYFETYGQTDSIENVDFSLQKQRSSSDPYKMLFQEFHSSKFQLALARKYSLKDVLELRTDESPVFKGLSLLQEFYDNPFEVLDNAFYMSLLHHYKKYKYKGVSSKGLKKKIKNLKKSYKKSSKNGFQSKIEWYKKIYHLYLEWIDYFKCDKIRIKNEAEKPTIPYCGTYVSAAIQEEKNLTADLEKEYTPVIKAEYNLNEFRKSIKNHGNFSKWAIFIAIVALIVFMLFGVLESVKKGIFGLLQKVVKTTITTEEFTELVSLPSMILMLFFVATGIVFVMAILILVFRFLSKRKYYALCRLSYYRRNEKILKDKEITEYEKLKNLELKYAKKIDRFYRFYGGILIFGLSVMIVISTLALLNFLTLFFLKDYAEAIKSIFDDKFYLVLAPGVVLMLLGFLRHKKTAWSVIFADILSLAATVGLIILTTMM